MISNHIKRQRYINAIGAGLLLLAGCAMAGVGAQKIISETNVPLPLDRYAERLIQHCVSTGQDFEFSVQRAGDAVVMQSHDLRDPLYSLSSASLVIERCAGFEMTAFCMGDGCDDALLHLELALRTGAQR